MRKPRKFGNYSVENYFNELVKWFPSNIEYKIRIVPFVSSGLIARMLNSFYCFLYQGDVNHITGDINYVGVFLKKKKTILTILDCGRLLQIDGLKLIIYKLFWFTIPIYKSRIITTISHAAQCDIIKNFPQSNCKVEFFYVTINSIFKFHFKLFDQSIPRILQVGASPNKNLSRLAQALEGIPCVLVIIGQPELSTIHILETCRINYVLLNHGLTDIEVFEEYCKCDIVSFVSTLEGFGMPIVEANAVGRVVLTSNISSMPEIAGDSAFFVDPFSVEDIRRGILKLLSDPILRENLIRSGFENVKRFSADEVALKYVNLYKSVYEDVSINIIHSNV